MTTTCPNGHDSTWPDWCSICGERLGPIEAAASASTPPSQSPSASVISDVASPTTGPSGQTCQNCGVPRHEHDVFCESCGYDFASGSLPEDMGSAGTGSGVGASGAVAEPAVPMHVRITVDPEFFTASAGDAELMLPDPLPPQQIVPLAGIRILIGRQSTSRGIFPEIDVRALTNDPAVSSRHAMLERGTDGSWTLTDLGSTNGTFRQASAEDAVEPGPAVPFAAGDAIYIGAWTRIELAETG